MELLARDGVVFHRSPILGAPHAFSTRIGGVSPPPFDSMNLGNPSGCDVQDDADRLAENYRRLMTAADLGGRHRHWAHQVHGATVIRAAGPRAAGAPPAMADALVTADASCAVCVRVADCVPVLLASADGAVVAAVHAGWRGVIAQVVPAAVAAMEVPPVELRAAIGPCISREAFEVGPEVLDAFAARFGPEADGLLARRDDGKGHVDLRAAIRLQLLAAGVEAANIDVSDCCTVRDAGEFFSHRRDRGVTGRMAAIIGPSGA